ncbi:hypothetical protein DFS33DRAFT_1277780 [Desarmillaria ectypa]|nr:hypothetical protein DFS33DRAFT_1277780 [Desarmillaria ectypa]
MSLAWKYLQNSMGMSLLILYKSPLMPMLPMESSGPRRRMGMMDRYNLVPLLYILPEEATPLFPRSHSLLAIVSMKRVSLLFEGAWQPQKIMPFQDGPSIFAGCSTLQQGDPVVDAACFNCLEPVARRPGNSIEHGAMEWESVDVVISVRALGVPALCFPETGSVSPAISSFNSTRTLAALRLEPSESLFVVFDPLDNSTLSTSQSPYLMRRHTRTFLEPLRSLPEVYRYKTVGYVIYLPSDASVYATGYSDVRLVADANGLIIVEGSNTEVEQDLSRWSQVAPVYPANAPTAYVNGRETFAGSSPQAGLYPLDSTSQMRS